MHLLSNFGIAVALLFLSNCLCAAVDEDNETGDMAEESEFPGLRECVWENDQQINECFDAMLTEIRPHLANGIPQIGIPPLEPLRLGELSFKLLGIECRWKNVTVHEFSKYSLLQMRIDSKRKAVDVEYALPHLRVTAIDQRGTNVLPRHLWVIGQAEFEIWNYRGNGTISLDFLPSRRSRGKPAWRVTDLKQDMYLDKIRVNAPHLANGGSVSRGIVNFLNNNGVPIFEQVFKTRLNQYLRDYLINRDLVWIPRVLPDPNTQVEPR